MAHPLTTRGPARPDTLTCTLGVLLYEGDARTWDEAEVEIPADVPVGEREARARRAFFDEVDERGSSDVVAGVTLIGVREADEPEPAPEPAPEPERWTLTRSVDLVVTVSATVGPREFVVPAGDCGEAEDAVYGLFDDYRAHGPLEDEVVEAVIEALRQGGSSSIDEVMAVNLQ